MSVILFLITEVIAFLFLWGVIVPWMLNKHENLYKNFNLNSWQFIIKELALTAGIVFSLIILLIPLIIYMTTNEKID